MKNWKNSPVGIIGAQYMRMDNSLIHRVHRKLLIKCYVRSVGATGMK